MDTNIVLKNQNVFTVNLLYCNTYHLLFFIGIVIFKHYKLYFIKP